jgi:hypothetical protein
MDASKMLRGYIFMDVSEDHCNMIGNLLVYFKDVSGII